MAIVGNTMPIRTHSAVETVLSRAFYKGTNEKADQRCFREEAAAAPWAPAFGNHLGHEVAVVRNLHHCRRHENVRAGLPRAAPASARFAGTLSGAYRRSCAG